MKEWALIYNPVSGKFSPKRLEGVCRVLREAGVEPRLCSTQGPGHATELARGVEGVERVVAMGGDGTLNEVANGLLGRELPLVFLPSGTGNAMAYELGIPRNPVRAARAMLQSQAVPIFPGMVGGRAFMLMAGFGFDAHAVYLVTKKLKKYFGPAAYFLTAALVLIKPKPMVALHTPDGRELKGTWAVGLRSRHYAGPFEMHPRANLKREELGVAVVPTAMIIPFAMTNLILRTGWAWGGIRLEEHRGFRVVAQRPVHVHVDGDYIFEGREFEVSVSERAVQFCFPSVR